CRSERSGSWSPCAYIVATAYRLRKLLRRSKATTVPGNRTNGLPLRTTRARRLDIHHATPHDDAVHRLGVRCGDLLEPQVAQHERGIARERIAGSTAAGRAHAERLAGRHVKAGNRRSRRFSDRAVGADDLERAGHAVAAAAEAARRFTLVTTPAADDQVAGESTYFADHGEAAAETPGAAGVRHERVAFDENRELGLERLDRQVRGVRRVVRDAVDPVLRRAGAAAARIDFV